MPRWFVPFLLGLAAMAAPAAAVGPYLISDLNTSRAPVTGPVARPGFDGVELDGFLYFAADDGLHGLELWRTDGTSEGTELVRDICPGPCSSAPSSLKVFGDLLGFRATDDLHGHELWVSDGTREGTRMPQDLCPGRCSSNANWLTTVGDRLFFVAYSTEQRPREILGVTDGTAAGTRIVLHPDRYQPIQMIGEFQGRLAFLGPGNAYWSALWLSDGTLEGTSLALDLCTSQECKGWERPIVVGNRIVFWNQLYGPEIWSSDGTAGGTLKIGNASPPFSPDGVTLWQGSLYFATVGGLWRTNGLPEGTLQLRSLSANFGTYASLLLPFDDVLLFVEKSATQGDTLWQTLGTPESTKIVSHPAPNDASAQLGPLTRVGNRVMFPVASEASSEIWETDGTTAGTRRLARVCGEGSPRCRPHETAPVYPVAVRGRYLFGLAEEDYGFELWTADAAGPRLLRDIRRNAGSSRFRSMLVRYGQEPAEPTREVAALGARLVFSGRTAPDKPASLWTSDGSAAGTLEIGPGISWPNGMARIGDRVWLRGSSSPPPGLYGQGLWSTDGTAAGTVGLAPDNLELYSAPGGRPGLVLAGAGDWGVGREPWVSDGTPAGTRLLQDINTQLLYPPFPGDGPIAGSSDAALFTPLVSSVLFAADDGLNGREPWITDGTAAGTRLLLDVNPLFVVVGGEPKPLSSHPGPFVTLRARAFFAADDGAAGRELWSTDGTTAGTARARDLRPGRASSNPRDLVKMGTRLFFLADDGASDALWSVAPAGTVKRVRLLASGQRASSLVAAGNRLFFAVDDPATGPELWTSDGTRPGTRLVREIRPGAHGSYPQELTAVDGLLLFAADDGAHGLEPWVTDGTAAGTRLLADLAPGLDASGPANFTVAGDLVGFDADDGVHGREMWGVRKGDLTP